MARPLDPYRTLELPRDATLDDVKAAYRRLAKLYHPDSAGERALSRFLAVQAAYEALTEGPGRLRATIGGRARPTTSTPGRSSSAKSGRPNADPWSGRATGTGPRTTRGAAGTSGSPGARPGTRTGAGAGGRAGAAPSASGSSADDGAPGGRGGSSRTRGTAGQPPRRTRRAPGSTSYDGAESEPFEPEWQGASWYGGSSGTYWTLNPREFADPRKHGPEYLARGADKGRRSSRPRRPRHGDGRPVGESGEAGASAKAARARAEGEGRAGWPEASHDARDDVWTADPANGWATDGPRSPTADGPSAWPLDRSSGTDVSAISLIAAALFGLALVAGLFALLTLPAAPGAASVVPVVAFGGIAIVVLVRVLRRYGRPRA